MPFYPLSFLTVCSYNPESILAFENFPPLETIHAVRNRTRPRNSSSTHPQEKSRQTARAGQSRNDGKDGSDPQASPHDDGAEVIIEREGLRKA